MNVIAHIGGCGVKSTVPDRDDAVDATIYADGTNIGGVTLLNDENGTLDTWGSMYHWADPEVQEWVYLDPDSVSKRISAIVDAVCLAHK